MQELFQPFNRLDAESGNIEGTGIGLALTKQLLEWMGGSIGVSSMTGKGSTTAHPQLMDRPVIALTANAMQDDVERGESAGFNAYLTKPVSIEKLIKALEKHIGELSL